MSSIEENLEREGKLPSFYRRYVDDTFTIMPNIGTASNSLDTLNKTHSSVKFTMETECNGMLPFLDIHLLNRSPQIETKVYVKPTNSSLLLHYQGHVDNRYKQGLLRTMLDRAHRLSSSRSHFSDECDRSKTVFSRLRWFETVFHFPFQLNFMKGLFVCSKRLLLLVDSRCCNNL